MPFPSPGTLVDPGIEPRSPALAGGFLTIELLPDLGKPIRDSRTLLIYAYIYFQKSLTDFQLYYLWLITLFETETAQVQ